MMPPRWRRSAPLLAIFLVACGLAPDFRAGDPQPNPGASREASEQGREIALYALSLIDTGYRFGGKNPEAGLDCSGMVSYIFERAAGIRLQGSAADIAKRGKPVDGARLRPGDLVFFNTRNKPRSHVGIYIGDGRFVHAPGSSGRIRSDSLDSGWFAARLEEARTYVD